jgi:dienelactone hydrolase
VLRRRQGFSDPESIQKVVDSMTAAGAAVELFMYDGSGHAFMNALTEKGRAKIKGEPNAARVAGLAGWG